MQDPLAHLKQGVNIDKQKSPENIAKDAEYNKPLKNPLDEQKEKVKNALYGNKESKEENTQKENKDVINSRYEANTGYTKEEVQEKLTNQAEREKNKDKATKLFYNESSIKGIIEGKNLDPEIATKKLEKYNSEAYQEDLQSIMGNFVTDVEGESLKEVFAEGEGSENSKKLLESLNLAFEMQINKITEGKANYDIEKVEDLIVELSDGDPFEKLEIFEKIKSLVNTSEGKNGNKDKKSIEETKKGEKTISEKVTENFKDLKNRLDMATNLQNEIKQDDLIQLLSEIKEFQDDNKSFGEVFDAGQIDVIKNRIEND